MRVLPQTFRRQAWAFYLSVAATVVGMVVGGVLLLISPEGREVALAPFPHVAQQTPSQRVAMEEEMNRHSLQRLEEGKGQFSGYLMQHNIQVSMATLALGMTYGIGTLVLLFYNGVILGGVALDYILDGQTVFLVGWLLPHGSFEIPAILIAGQAGFILARALIGWGTREGLRTRLRLVTPDLATLIGGVALITLHPRRVRDPVQRGDGSIGQLAGGFAISRQWADPERIIATALSGSAILLIVAATGVAGSVGTLLLVMLVELLNSAIECVIDKLIPEFNELAGRAKDMGSAAVFLAMMALLATWVAILWPRFA